MIALIMMIATAIVAWLVVLSSRQRALSHRLGRHICRDPGPYPQGERRQE